jgi:hypothetical protein
MSIRLPALRISAIIVVSAILGLSACVSSGTSTSNSQANGDNGNLRGKTEVSVPARNIRTAALARESASRTGEIYLMRGLMDIFSRGIDMMAAQMRKQGLYAVDTSYTEWKKISDDIIHRSKEGEVSYPIVIIGHSLGANDASKMASYLGANGVKISLVVTFDPTEPGYVGKNIGTVVNYYLPNDNNKIYKRKGFNGSIANVDMSKNPDIKHTTIEKNPELQAKVLGRVMRLTRKRRS